MPDAIRKALVSSYATYKGIDSSAAENIFRELEQKGRYQTETWSWSGERAVVDVFHQFFLDELLAQGMVKCAYRTSITKYIIQDIECVLREYVGYTYYWFCDVKKEKSWFSSTSDNNNLFAAVWHHDVDMSVHDHLCIYWPQKQPWIIFVFVLLA